MFQGCYNKKRDTLTIKDELFMVEDAKLKLLPKASIIKYNDKGNVFKSCEPWHIKRPFLHDLIQGINDYIFDSNNELEINMFSKNIIYFTFGYTFNQNIPLNSLPKNLTSLIFGHNYNLEIRETVLPITLTCLIFGHEYNQKIKKGVIPQKLISLTFGNNFNQIILSDSLPNNLQELIFGYGYNHSIFKNTLPKKLLKLTFGHSFNSEFFCPLPTHITYLFFGHNYNRIIEKDVLPRNLKILYFYGSINNSNTINMLPDTVEEIALYNLKADISNLPLFFKKVKIMANIYENYDDIVKIKVPFGCVITNKSNTEINIYN